MKLPTFDDYKSNLSAYELLLNQKLIHNEAIERHYRILSCLMTFEIEGPTLDIASGNAIFYPSLHKYKPSMLPYSVTDMVKKEILYSNQKIECFEFECEKTLLPLEDCSQGCVMFCDIIEHLLVDPVWAILEFNRVLRIGGKIVISTPNACHIKRVYQVLQGHNSATENHIKPTSIYQRHNREWTLNELNTVLRLCGFSNSRYSTHPYLLSELEKKILELAKSANLTTLSELDFGPEIFFIAEKSEHKTLTTVTDLEERWPDWLYSHFANYRRRPEVFPIVLGKDYA